jgi:hypothetical protein
MNSYIIIIGLLVGTALLLRNKKTYLIIFVFGFLLNNIINILLKIIIQEPKLTENIDLLKLRDKFVLNVDKLGMPSNDLQNCSFCLIFINFVLKNPLITCLYIVITGVVFYIKYLFNVHSILQLVIAFFVGMGVGYFTYVYALKLVKGSIQNKCDDNYKV